MRFEIQVETPQLIIGATGRIPVAEAIAVGSGRVSSLHYGTYDYSASLQISAEYQASDHPAADFAKQVMQVAVAGTPVHLSDGSTNVLPTGSTDQVHSAWRLHAGLVRRALERGFYQGWDLHPGQLPTRFAATFAFYRSGAARAGRRLSDYLGEVRLPGLGRAGHRSGTGPLPAARLVLRSRSTIRNCWTSPASTPGSSRP